MIFKLQKYLVGRNTMCCHKLHDCPKINRYYSKSFLLYTDLYLLKQLKNVNTIQWTKYQMKLSWRNVNSSSFLFLPFYKNCYSTFLVLKNKINQKYLNPIKYCALQQVKQLSILIEFLRRRVKNYYDNLNNIHVHLN